MCYFPWYYSHLTELIKNPKRPRQWVYVFIIIILIKDVHEFSFIAQSMFTIYAAVLINTEHRMKR